MSFEQHVSSMRGAVRNLRRLGLEKEIAPVTEALERVNALDQRAADLTALARQARNRLVEGLISGKADTADLLLAAAVLGGSGNNDTRTAVLNGAVSAARAVLQREAYEVGRTMGRDLVDALAARAAAAVAKADKAKLPKDVTTEVEALRADPAGFKAVHEALDVFRMCHDAYAVIRRIDWISFAPDVHPEWYVYADPDKAAVKLGHDAAGEPIRVYWRSETRDTLSSGARTEKLYPPIAFWRSIKNGAKPGVYQPDVAAERCMAWARRMDQRDRASLGNWSGR